MTVDKHTVSGVASGIVVIEKEQFPDTGIEALNNVSSAPYVHCICGGALRIRLRFVKPMGPLWLSILQVLHQPKNR